MARGDKTYNVLTIRPNKSREKYVSLQIIKNILMKATEQTLQQVERFTKKLAQKFPSADEPMLLTDIHIRVSQENGDMTAFDDDDNEITRCVIEQWIDNSEEGFYDEVTRVLRTFFQKNASLADSLGIMKPYSFVLETDEKEPFSELYVADNDTVLIGGDLMKGLDKDLDNFLNDLLGDRK